MKKKNLNFLLALLAALALVFAGACSDGSDDDSSGGTTTDDTQNPSNLTEADYSIYSGASYKADYETENAKLAGSGSSTNANLNLGSVTLEFASGSSNAVTLTAVWGATGSNATPVYTGVEANLTGTYTVGDSNAVTITFSGAGDSNGDTAATLVLTAGSDDNGSGLPDTLTIASGTSNNLYVTSGESRLDLFSSTDFAGTYLGGSDDSQAFAEVVESED